MVSSWMGVPGGVVVTGVPLGRGEGLGQQVASTRRCPVARGVVETGWPVRWHFCSAEVGGQAGSGVPQLRWEIGKAQVSEDVFFCGQVHNRLLR